MSHPPLIPLPVEVQPLSGDATLAPPVGSGELDDASYSLRSSPRGIQVSAAQPAGMAAARATLGQLGQPPPGLEISDSPRYRWRGVMIDIARHFFGVRTLCKIIDLLASYKFNVLHLHLSDDQGWRLEVPTRPLLTERSAGVDMSGGPGGYLRQSELVEVVAYAADQGISVVGEIDTPGHVTAALHAIAELNGDGRPPPLVTTGGIFEAVLDFELPATRPFLADVFGSLAAATPSDFLHVGGDEVQSVSRGVYRDSIRELEHLVLGLGKRPIFWQEAAFALTDTRSVVQLWNSTTPADEVVDAARRGHQVIISPSNRLYFDMKHDSRDTRGVDWAGTVGLRDVYDLDPDTEVPGLPAAQILGIEVALWTETIASETDLFSMLLPRLAAAAEVAWSPQAQRVWESFSERLQPHQSSWRRRGFAYWEPTAKLPD